MRSGLQEAHMNDVSQKTIDSVFVMVAMRSDSVCRLRTHLSADGNARRNRTMLHFQSCGDSTSACAPSAR